MSPQTIANVCIDVACDYFQVTREAIMGRSRPANLCWPRHVAMSLAYELSGLSTNALKVIFNRGDHATILHAQRVVLLSNKSFQVEAIRQIIQRRIA